jgi:DNA-binding MarR family transcriptional regulator
MTVPGRATEQARKTLAMLPALRHWAKAHVETASADVALSIRQFAALHGIREGASSPGDLARLWQVTPAVITGIVDRLESHELVRREADPDDRRRLRLALTERGHAACDAVERALTQNLAAQLARHATDHELAELDRALDLLQRTFAALDEQSPRTAPHRHAEEDARGELAPREACSLHRRHALATRHSQAQKSAVAGL